MDLRGFILWILVDPVGGSVCWIQVNLCSGSWCFFRDSWLPWKEDNDRFRRWILLVDPGVDPGVDPDATSRCGTLMDLVFWWKPVVIQVGFLRHILLDPCGGSWRGSCGGSRWWILLNDPSGSW